MIASFAIAIALAQEPSAPVSKILPNGVTVVAISLPSADSFSAQTFVLGGVAIDDTQDSGTAHLLEHLLFRREMDVAAEKASCVTNATTFHQFMRFYCSGAAESWQVGARIAADCVRRAPDLERLEIERRVVNEEIGYLQHDTNNALDNMLARLAFGWLPPAGTKDTLARITGTKIENAYKNFVGANVIAVIAGSFEAKDAIALMEELYAQIPSGPRLSISQPARIKAAFLSEDIHVEAAFACSAPGAAKPEDYAAFEIAAEALRGRLAAKGLTMTLETVPSSNFSLAILKLETIVGFAKSDPKSILNGYSEALTQAQVDTARAALLEKYEQIYRDPNSAAMMAGIHFLFAGKNLRTEYKAALKNVSLEQVRTQAKALQIENGVYIEKK